VTGRAGDEFEVLANAMVTELSANRAKHQDMPTGPKAQGPTQMNRAQAAKRTPQPEAALHLLAMNDHSEPRLHSSSKHEVER
jgi:hypothetical protein